MAAATGKVNGCRDFEAGNSEYFDLADNTDLSTGNVDFTFACWIQLESKGADRDVIAKVSAAGLIEYQLRFQASSDRLQWRVTSDGTNNFTSLNADVLGAPSTATWYFVVVWHDSVSNVIGISVDAGASNTAPYSAGVFDGTASFVIGREGDRNTDYWDGLVDEVGFWKRVLTSDERTELYNAGAGRDYAYITGGASFVPFPRPRGARAGMLTLVGGMH